ncbi:TetR family transcriptional regulator [Nocardiopsis sp. EMB25]|uniref:TetR/AcrR family transcriptional regulator n=1 Tax=Nocardiopsis sp. EMB25 TaxID=2835867 RepID=UPI00228384D7|nr:TetR family transcriptional regulator [Nocardiopsis sp. EMB25]MCY9785476.1 TetR family transcriptional regulator [Nocardiopsis sp. EMB25]
MMNMNSISGKPPDRSEDLTARARIRDAAVDCFGQRGFDVPVREIAERAGVSPALVMHHFGTKAKLRVACEEHVMRIIREVKTESITTKDQTTVLHHLAEAEEFAPYMAFLFRCLQAGGDLARTLYEHMAADIEAYLDAGVKAGTVRPSRDPEARARWLAATGGGSLLMLVTLRHPGPDVDFRRVIREWSEEFTLPALELYTEGLLADRSMLDAYLLYVSDPPEDSS